MRCVAVVLTAAALVAGLAEGQFLVDTSRFAIPQPYGVTYPAIAYGGAGFLVVWEDLRGRDIYGCRVAPNGVLLDPFGIAICRARECQSEPSVCFDGTNFVVVWRDGRGDDQDIYGCRVTPAGGVLDPEGIPICTAAENQVHPVVSFDGANALVVWQDWQNGNYADVYGARLTPQGIVLDPRGIVISSSTSHGERPAVASDGAGSLVVWEDYRSGETDIYGCRVTPGGAVLDPQGIPISTAEEWQYAPAVAFDGDNFLVVWEDRGSGWDICGSRVTPAGSVLEPQGIAISTAANEQLAVDLTFDGANFLVVWQDMRNAVEVYGARVAPEGSVLDPEGFPIVVAECEHYSPVVASDSTNALVVWLNDWVYGVRVTQQGTVLDSQDILVSATANEQGTPALASDGTDFLAVWVDQRNYSSDLYGARVTDRGVTLDPQGIPVSVAVERPHSPVVDFDSANFLVVWGEDRNETRSDIRACRVTPQGVVLDSQSIPVAAGNTDEWLPAVCYDGTNFLVVWQDWRDINYSDIYGSRVTSRGGVLDPQGIPISNTISSESRPDVASDGVGSFVVWDDWRNGELDIYGARVTAQGNVLDTLGIAVATAAGIQRSPALTFGGRVFLAVWDDYRNGDAGDIYCCRVTQTGTVLDPQGICVCAASGVQQSPVVSLDGADFLVVWEDGRDAGGWGLYGARVRPDGTVYDEGPVVRQEDSQTQPALARSAGGQVLLLYQSWAGAVGGKVYNTMRIWGMLNPHPGVEQAEHPGLAAEEGSATILRGVLMLTDLGHDPTSPGGFRSCPASLLDAAGRRVMELQAGANDVSRLAPGVYFVRQEGSKGVSERVSKVVITK